MAAVPAAVVEVQLVAIADRSGCGAVVVPEIPRAGRSGRDERLSVRVGVFDDGLFSVILRGKFRPANCAVRPLPVEAVVADGEVRVAGVGA